MAASSCISKPAPPSKLPTVPSKLSAFLSRAPQWPPQSFTNNKHSFNLYYIFHHVLLQQPPTIFNMLFNTLTVLGFAALAVAGKHCPLFFRDSSNRMIAPALERKEAIKLPARGVNFVPRQSLTARKDNSRSRNSWRNFGNNFNLQTVITETTVNVLQIDANPLLEAQVQEETLLAQTLTESLIGAQVQFNQALDNIRINTLNQLNNNVVCLLPTCELNYKLTKTEHGSNRRHHDQRQPRLQQR